MNIVVMIIFILIVYLKWLVILQKKNKQMKIL